ncbi:hypothetical protein R1sor_006886 [Riccia sorocarpa]|uniref:RNA helicase n=1 Tax=Riccia sorocarpa TaxID=122646 RepID=A0ABD3HSI7_9MARC
MNGRDGAGAGRGGGRGRGRGGISAGWRPVSEADRISIAERLEQFRASDEKELTFEAGLSNHDRAVVHDFCKKMGFKSKSHGKGDARRVAVTKPSGGQGKGQSTATALSFSADAQEAIVELFSCFPPTEDELLGKETIAQPCQDAVPKPRRAKATGRNALTFTPAEISRQVSEMAARLKNSPALQQIAKDRSKLPIASFQDSITSAVENNQVVLIAGETGCGKTTQVPQYILNHMWQQGKPCRILCTQPRRISATSVAERIATELGEQIGDTVGYQIRLESKGGKHSSLLFCTNGVVLRKIVGAGGNSKEQTGEDGASDESDGLDATHIIVDEIHERDRNADFLLIVLRDLLPVRPDLRLILMSATLDADLFSSYFHGCPIVRVPGFTYPVRTFYLEDVLAMTGNGTDVNSKGGPTLSQEDADIMDEAISNAWLDDDFELLLQLLTDDSSSHLCDYQHPLTGATALMVAAGKGRMEDVQLLLSLGADRTLLSKDGATALDWASTYGHEDVVDLLKKYQGEKMTLDEEAEMLRKYQASVDQEEIDVRLIERLLLTLCRGSIEESDTSQNGAVLIFLPGWEDIIRCRECLQASPVFCNHSQYLLLPLHSMVPAHEQRKVFQRPPNGVRKIVLATNIAESAITIDDVVYVIDSGRIKEKSYDPYSNVSTLQTAWISRASSKQREGRAGRCRPGICYHLFSRTRAAALPDFQLPEIKRTPLEELCLQVKLLDPNGKIGSFISKAIDPPLDLAVRNAIILLQDLGALTPDERLTDLGKQLGSLPAHPSTSKMLLLAILLNCLDPALTMACAAGYREPFVLPMLPDQKKRAQQAKHELTAAYGGYSDHLAVIAAFDGWEAAKVKGQEARFCSQYFISSGIMTMLAGMRRQLQNELAQKGFIPKGPHPCSLNARDPGIVRAVLAAGMYPMVGVLLPPLPTGQKAVIRTSRGEKVRIHPHSENFRLNRTISQGRSSSKDLLLVFDEVTRGEAQIYIRNSTLLKPHPIIFVATEMVVAPLDPSEEIPVEMEEDEDEVPVDSEDEDDPKPRPGPDTVRKRQGECMAAPDRGVAVVIDRWLRFSATAVEAAQFYCLRERLNAAVSFKIKNPREKLPPDLAASVYTIACILSFDNILNLEPAGPSRASPASGAGTASRMDSQAWFRGGQGQNNGGNRKEQKAGVFSENEKVVGRPAVSTTVHSQTRVVRSEKRYIRQDGKPHARNPAGRGNSYVATEQRQKVSSNTGSGRGTYVKRSKNGGG